MKYKDNLYEITFVTTLEVQVPVMDSAEDREEFLNDWVKTTYPEFYDTVIEEIKEVNG